MIPLAQEYLDRAAGDRARAVEEFARDLMRGDSATFKAGYTLDNALIATTRAFGLTYDEQSALIGRLT